MIKKIGDLVYFAHLLETPSVRWYMKACRVQQSIKPFRLPNRVSLKPVSQWTFGGSGLTTIKMTFQWNTLWKCYHHSNVLLYTRKLRPKVVTYIVSNPSISTPLKSYHFSSCMCYPCPEDISYYCIVFIQNDWTWFHLPSTNRIAKVHISS